jgi:glucan 1,3-beta-glucosidase
MPTIKAASTFSKTYILDGFTYGGPWKTVNMFWRSIRNFNIDMTAIPPTTAVTAIHWGTAQATSLQNIVIRMSTTTGVTHRGLFIEDGSGGYVGDLVIYGGDQGLAVGSQQFTMRNITVNGANFGIVQAWNWGWTYKGLTLTNCKTAALDITGLGASGGDMIVIDSTISNSPVGVDYTSPLASSTLASGVNIILENVQFVNIPVAVRGDGSTMLAGQSAGTVSVAAWGRGHQYSATGARSDFLGSIQANSRPAGLTAGSDYYERSKPTYSNLPVSQFISVRDAGAKGDGTTDDTAALNAALALAAASGKVLFFDYGQYVVTSTIYVPGGSRIVGESYPVILSSGSFFANAAAPKPVVQVGLSGEAGVVEWSDMIVSTRGAQPGAIIIEWNLASTRTPSAMWDVHVRVGGFKGSNLQVANCPTTMAVGNPNCVAAFLSFHITPSATGLYMENVWVWVADHDMDDSSLTQITVYAGRGMLIESALGNIWGYATAVEHHTMYEYQLVGTKNIMLGQIQTESAYYQSAPAAPAPFAINALYNDPTTFAGSYGWGLRVLASNNVFIYGAGLYSFYDNYSLSCSDQFNGAQRCQPSIISIESSSVSIYDIHTVGTTNMITVDGTNLAPYTDNRDGYSAAVGLFRN